MAKFYAVSLPFIGEVYEFNTKAERDDWITDQEQDGDLDIERKAITPKEMRELFAEYDAEPKRVNDGIYVAYLDCWLRAAILRGMCNHG